VARFRIDGFHIASIALRSARIDERYAAKRSHRFEIEDKRGIRLTRTKIA